MSAAGQDAEEVRGLVITAGEVDLLLPNAAVAEVLGYQKPTPYDAAPPWLLGAVIWLDRAVPLISLAEAGQGSAAAAPGQRARLVVCFTPNGNPELPYVAFLAMGGPPRLTRFRAPDLIPETQSPDNPLVLHALTFGERPAWIPDMDAIEQAVLGALVD